MYIYLGKQYIYENRALGLMAVVIIGNTSTGEKRHVICYEG